MTPDPTDRTGRTDRPAAPGLEELHDRLRDHHASPNWGEAARQVVTYRSIFGLVGDDPIGPRPDPNQQGKQLQAWHAAHSALAACTPPPDVPPTAAERLLAHLTDHERDTRYDDDRRTDGPSGPSRHL